MPLDLYGISSDLHRMSGVGSNRSLQATVAMEVPGSASEGGSQSLTARIAKIEKGVRF